MVIMYTNESAQAWLQYSLNALVYNVYMYVSSENYTFSYLNIHLFFHSNYIFLYSFSTPFLSNAYHKHYDVYTIIHYCTYEQYSYR